MVFPFRYKKYIALIFWVFIQNICPVTSNLQNFTITGNSKYSTLSTSCVEPFIEKKKVFSDIRQQLEVFLSCIDRLTIRIYALTHHMYLFNNFEGARENTQFRGKIARAIA